MSQLFNVNGRWITLEQYQELLNPTEETKVETKVVEKVEKPIVKPVKKTAKKTK